MQVNFLRSILFAAVLGGSFAVAWAQVGAAPGGYTVAWAQAEPVPAGPAVMPPIGGVTVQTSGAGMGFQFVSGEPAFSTGVNRPVKGAPFSLEAAVETTQTLSDGNRIVHHQLVRLYRDSKGRTRREETLAAIGPWAASGTPPTMVTIQDPVSGVSYFLDPQRKVAGKMPALTLPRHLSVAADAGDGPTTAIAAASVGGRLAAAGDRGGPEEGSVVVFGVNSAHGQFVQPEEKSESLGKETVAGTSADGTRTTTTIPADAVGNERPIDIVRERWYSTDLQIVVRSKQSDPRFGETTYEVNKLDRAEPAPSLFEVPADYKVKQPEHQVFKEKP